ncbi:hypothetical protein BH20VER2_BH20VER2_12420 [soil metagenome]
MKKATRLTLIVAGVLLGLGIVALLAVNLYVQSQSTQARIQHELSQRLGTPLHIQRISVTPWWGLKLTGITMPQEDGSVESAFLRADTFRLRVRVASLFARRLVITEVSLINPKVVWAQNEDGKWRLPASLRLEEEAPAAEPERLPGSPEIAAAPVSPEPAPDSALVPPEPEEDPARFTPEVRRVNLTNGSFRFLDANRNPVATFEGVRFRSDFRDATAVRGNASIAKTALRNRFYLESLQSPIKYDPTELEFSDIRARAAGGEITGRFKMNPLEADSPFQVTVKFRELHADQIVTDAGGPVGMVEGQIEGHLEAFGNTADPNALRGAGEIVLRDGQLRQYSLLVALGQLLRIDELKQLHFDQAHVKYRIEPGVVTIDELLLTSPNIRLSATGTVHFNGRLRLESQLAINERIREQLFRPVRENFLLIGEPGYAAVNFQISGTLERPRTNLVDKIVGPELRDLGGVLNSLLGGGRSERVKRKQRAAAAAREAAAAAAGPTPLEVPVPVPVETMDAADAVMDATPAPPPNEPLARDEEP